MFTVDSRTASPAASSRRTAAVLLAVEGLLMFVPLGVLGSAIGWPASLDDPAAVALPRLLENEGAVRLGYTAYLAYSVLFLPVAIWTTHTLTRGADGPVARLAIGFAVASTLARCVGILRWLTAMPVLAESYVTAPDEATRTALAADYELLNAFGGGIGELLGVALFAAGWLVTTLVAAWRVGPDRTGPEQAGAVPRWLLVVGAVPAAGLALPLVELAGLDAGPLVPVGAASLQLWFLAAAFVLARTAGRRS